MFESLMRKDKRCRENKPGSSARLQHRGPGIKLYTLQLGLWRCGKMFPPQNVCDCLGPRPGSLRTRQIPHLSNPHCQKFKKVVPKDELQFAASQSIICGEGTSPLSSTIDEHLILIPYFSRIFFFETYYYSLFSLNWFKSQVGFSEIPVWLLGAHYSSSLGPS